MSKNRPLTEVQILNGTHDVATKTGGKGFGAGSIVSANATAETITIANTPVAVSTEKEPEAAPAMTEESIKQMIDSALTTATSQITEAQQKAADQEAAATQLNQELANEQAEKVAAQAEVDRLNNELAEARKAADALSELGKLTGASAMQETKSLEVLGTGSQEMRNWQRLLETATTSTVYHNDAPYSHRDDRAAREYLKRNLNQVRGGVEAVMREAGLLGGHMTNAPTVMADIPSAAFDYLSEFVRQPSDSDLIYWQFAREHSVPGTAPRFQGQVPRYPFSPGPAAKADRVLTVGTDIVGTRQATTEKLTPVTIEELGLGAGGSPIALTRFVEAFSMTNLEQIVSRNLGRDYNQTKDLFIRSEWAAATTVVYNDGGRVGTAPASVGNADGGTLSRAFLRSLFSYMYTARIPTYSNGHYVLTVTSNQLNYLLSELATLQRFPEPTSSETEMVSQVLQRDNGTEYGGMVSGYRLICDGFMIFVQNVHSIGASGTEGVQTETTSATTAAQVTETCYAAGADTVCWATALPVSIVEDEVTDFRRRRSFIWYSHENSAPLDVNVNSGTGQETRVIKCNLLRNPV